MGHRKFNFILLNWLNNDTLFDESERGWNGGGRKTGFGLLL